MKRHALFILLLVAVLTVLFSGVIFNPDLVVFSNDSPYGSQASDVCRIPDLFFHGTWNTLNYTGLRDPDVSPLNVTSGIRTLCWYGVLPDAMGLLLGGCVFVLLVRLDRFRERRIFRALWSLWGAAAVVVGVATVAGMIEGFRAEVLQALGSLDGVMFTAGLFLYLAFDGVPTGPTPEERELDAAFWRRFNETGQT